MMDGREAAAELTELSCSVSEAKVEWGKKGDEDG